RLYSGTGAAGLSYDDIRAIRIPVLSPRDQEAVRTAFLRVHAAHEAALAVRGEGAAPDPEGTSPAFRDAIGRAQALVAALVAALEDYIVAPCASGLAIDLGSVSTSGPLRLTATVCSE